MFGCKKEKKNAALFGSNIEPNCAYCANSVNAQGAVKCRIGQIPEDSHCRRYTYDPLRRTPKGQPKLADFTAKDFEL